MNSRIGWCSATALMTGNVAAKPMSAEPPTTADTTAGPLFSVIISTLIPSFAEIAHLLGIDHRDDGQGLEECQPHRLFCGRLPHRSENRDNCGKSSGEP